MITSLTEIALNPYISAVRNAGQLLLLLNMHLVSAVAHDAACDRAKAARSLHGRVVLVFHGHELVGERSCTVFTGVCERASPKRRGTSAGTRSRRRAVRCKNCRLCRIALRTRHLASSWPRRSSRLMLLWHDMWLVMRDQRRGSHVHDAI